MSIQDFVVPLCPSMARQMPNLLYFRGLTIRFVSIRLEVQFRIAPTKAKFNKENVQYETVRHDMAFPHLLYFSLWPICGRSSLELEYNEMTGTLFLYLVPSEYIFISSQISVTRFKAPTNMQKNLPIENLLDEYFKALNATYSIPMMPASIATARPWRIY